MSVQNKFWIVVNKNFPSEVTYKHDSYENAERESKRLALNHAGEEFVIMESLRSYVKMELIMSDFVDSQNNPEDTDYIPF